MPPTMLVLASTSAYRRALLARLRLPFETMRPEVDETALADEGPARMAERLAFDKARSVALRFPDAWVIGSDQVADIDGHAMGKPGSFENAADQLSAASGRRIKFHTALCLLRQRDGRCLRACDLTTVQFRVLDSATIERYLHAEQPYDCAGSFKSEGLGISLFTAIESLDPTALIGLPLIALSAALREAGFTLP